MVIPVIRAVIGRMNVNAALVIGRTVIAPSAGSAKFSVDRRRSVVPDVAADAPGSSQDHTGEG